MAHPLIQHGVFKVVWIFLTTCLTLADMANIHVRPEASRLYVGLGNDQALDCFVSDDLSSGSILNWTQPSVRDNVVVQNLVDATNISHSILTIHGFKGQNQESYICSLQASAGQSNKTAIQLFLVNETELGGEYRYGDQSATLECGLVGLNASFQTWLKGDQPVSQLTDSPRFKSYDNGTLVITGPVRKDAGIYTARYTFTEDFGPYDCHVVYKAAPLVLDMDKSKNLVEGDQLELTCSVLGYPMPAVTWWKDGVELKNSSRVQTLMYENIDNARLVIKLAKFSDEGKYTCEAADADDRNSTKTITVRVKDRLAWLWPIIGILCEAVVLGIFIFICSQLQKRYFNHESEEPRADTHNMEHTKTH